VTHEIGTIAHVDRAQQLPDGRSLLACTGRERVRLIERTQTDPYPMGRFATLVETALPPSAAADALVERVRQSVRRALESVRALLPPEREEQRAALERAIHAIPAEAAELSYFVPRVLFTASSAEKQRLLEARDPLARLTLALPLVLLEERLATQRPTSGSSGGSLN
jgi:Lon protease-like protein